MKNIILRSISGSVYVALIVCAILFGSFWGFPALMCVFVAAGIFEFQKMTLDDFYESPRILLVDLIIGISLPALVVAYIDPVLQALLLMFMSCMLILRFVAQLYSHSKNPVRHIGVSILSIIYVAVPLTIASVIGVNSPQMTIASVIGVNSPKILLLMFVMVWLNDTGAFLVGSAIGSHRLFERLSPKKSWEGFFGGLAFSIAAGYIAKALFPDAFYGLSGNMLGLMGAVVSVMSTWGDLFESMIKRHSGVKDSGSIIPGHGGILDRIDSLLFVAPALMLFLAIVALLESVCFIPAV